MKKNELRKIYIQKRKELSAEIVEAYSQKISDMFFQKIMMSKYQKIHIFLPIEKKTK